MRFFSKTRLILAGGVFMGLFAFHAPLCLYSLLSVDKQFLPDTRSEIEVFRYALLGMGLLFFLAALIWHIARYTGWFNAISDDFEAYVAENPVFDPLVRQHAFMWMWSGIMSVVFLGLLITIRLSFTYQDHGVRWYDLLALEDGVWEMLTALGLLAAGVVLLWGGIKYRKMTPVYRLVMPIGLGVVLCLAAGEEMSWGQRWLGYATPEAVKAVNVQGEFTIHNAGGRWANQVMILFFLSYIGLAPLFGSLFVDIRYCFERLRIPLAPLGFAPWGFVGVLFDERPFFSCLWGNPPWYLDEARETLFGVVMLGVILHSVISWQKMSKTYNN